MIRALDDRLLRWADAFVLWAWDRWAVRKGLLTRSACFLSAGLFFVGQHELRLGLLLGTVFQLVTQALTEWADPAAGRDAGFLWRVVTAAFVTGAFLGGDWAQPGFLVWFYLIFARVPPKPPRRRRRAARTVVPQGVT